MSITNVSNIGCSDCTTIQSATFDPISASIEFAATAASYIEAPIPFENDFTVALQIKFTEPCGSSQAWWLGCGLVTALANYENPSYLGCFHDSFTGDIDGRWEQQQKT
jgi:hypothetical protein